MTPAEPGRASDAAFNFPTTPEGNRPGNDTVPTATEVGNGLYALLTFICTFFPAIGHQIAPGGKVGEKQDAFFAIYIATAPLSLTATFIFLMLFRKWFDNDTERLVAAAGAIILSAFWAIGFGQTYADLNSISELRGPPLAVLAGAALVALFAYAVYYGAALFVAGVLASLFAAMWLNEKAGKRLS